MSHRPNIFQGISVFHQPDRFVFSFTLLTNPWILWTPNIFCFLLLHTVIHDVDSVCPSPWVICFLNCKNCKPNICISPPAVPECAHTQLGKGGGSLTVQNNRHLTWKCCSGQYMTTDKNLIETKCLQNFAFPHNCCNHLSQISDKGRWIKRLLWKLFKATSGQQRVAWRRLFDTTWKTQRRQCEFSMSTSRSRLLHFHILLLFSSPSSLKSIPPSHRGVSDTIYSCHCVSDPTRQISPLLICSALIFCALLNILFQRSSLNWKYQVQAINLRRKVTLFPPSFWSELFLKMTQPFMLHQQQTSAPP